MRALRLLKWLAIGMVGFAIAAGFLLYILTARSLPDYNAEYSAAGLSAEVEIVRDGRAVPHIFAKADKDVYFALGFTHAQDRLWQMEVSRRIAQGRISEVAPEGVSHRRRN